MSTAGIRKTSTCNKITTAYSLLRSVKRVSIKRESNNRTNTQPTNIGGAWCARFMHAQMRLPRAFAPVGALSATADGSSELSSVCSETACRACSALQTCVLRSVKIIDTGRSCASVGTCLIKKLSYAAPTVTPEKVARKRS